MSDSSSKGHLCAVCYKPASLRCARCKSVWYCGAACQKKDWKLGHKALCRSSTTSAAAAGSSGGSGTPSSAVNEALETGANLPRPPKPTAWLVNPSAVLSIVNEPLSVPPLQCGLLNIDNWSCFMNSTLQALFAVASFRSFLLSQAHTAMAEASTHKTRCILCWLEDFARKHAEACLHAKETGVQAVICPSELPAMLTSLDDGLVPGRQHDAHEFLIALMKRCSNASTLGCTDGSIVDTSVVAQLFSGWLCRTITCPSCRGNSVTHERFMSLSADVTNATDNLNEAMRSLFAPECLDADNLYHCGHCGKDVRAQTRMFVASAPPVLIVQLKRFRFSFLGKCTKYIAFPDKFTLKPFMIHATADEAPVYRLCAVVVHLDLGGMSFFGHYVAYVQSSTGQWYLANDNHITMVPASQVMASQAYLLIYQQIPTKYKPFDTTSISSIKNTIVSAFHPELCKPETGSKATQPLDSEDLDDEMKAALAMSMEESKEKTPKMCPTGCGFYGSEETRGYCSACFRRNFPAEAKKLEEERKKRQAERDRAEQEMRKLRLEEESAKAQRATKTTSTSTPASTTPAEPQSITLSNTQTPKTAVKVARNALCPCGSGLKYKQCHGKMNQ